MTYLHLFLFEDWTVSLGFGENLSYLSPFSKRQSQNLLPGLCCEMSISPPLLNIKLLWFKIGMSLWVVKIIDLHLFSTAISNSSGLCSEISISPPFLNVYLKLMCFKIWNAILGFSVNFIISPPYINGNVKLFCFNIEISVWVVPRMYFISTFSRRESETFTTLEHQFGLCCECITSSPFVNLNLKLLCFKIVISFWVVQFLFIPFAYLEST